MAVTAPESNTGVRVAGRPPTTDIRGRGVYRSAIGLFNRMKDPVDGIAQVVSSSHPPDGAVWQSCRLQLVIQASGMEATAVEDTVNVRTSKWPQPGAQLPVRVDRANPQKFKILWDEVETGRDQARRQAQAIADSANQGGGTASDGAVPPEAQQVVDQLQTMFPGAQIQSESQIVSGAEAADALQAMEQALNQDIDGDGQIGGAGARPPADPAADAVDSNDDRIAQLERLGRLHTDGLLTDDEFAAEKARLLEN